MMVAPSTKVDKAAQLVDLMKAVDDIPPADPFADIDEFIDAVMDTPDTEGVAVSDDAALSSKKPLAARPNS
jgi:hypothetical protein